MLKGEMHLALLSVYDKDYEMEENFNVVFLLKSTNNEMQRKASLLIKYK